MNDFHNAVNYVNRVLYKPNNLIIKNQKEEKQNSDYGAGIFQLNSKSIRFRVAKITPNKIGQFIFPKNILIEKGILKTDDQDGKMGIRVYPRWDTPDNKQAIATQKWQLSYFIGLSGNNKLYNEEILKLLY